MVLANDYGPLFWLYVVYGYAFLFASLILLIPAASNAESSHRRQLLALAGGVLLPAIGGAAHVLGLGPEPTPNYLGYAYIGTAVTFSYTVYRHDLFSAIPIARRTTLEQLDDGHITFNSHGRIVNVNAAASDYLKQSRTELLEHNRKEVLGEFGSALNFDSMTAQEATIETAGSVFDLTFSPLIRGDTVVGSQLLIRDVTARHLREQELKETKARLEETNARLEQTNKRLDDFASVVAHDLRNPLAAAMGYTEIVEETGKQAHFDKVESAHDRMERLIEDLLILARNETTVNDFREIDLGVIARDAWEFVDMPEASLTVTDDVPVVNGDPRRMVQLFENVFRNAIEHGGDSPHITIGELPEEAGFFIEDDGVGIPPDMRDTVFEHGVTTNENGTGFGLSIVADIAAVHGWDVTVTSGADGGARFEFSQQ